MTTADVPALSYSSALGRWVLLVTVLGSGIASLDATVVNIALPTIGRDCDTGIASLQWVMNGYTLTLAAFLLIGGSLGDGSAGRRSIWPASCGSPWPRRHAGLPPAWCSSSLPVCSKAWGRRCNAVTFLVYAALTGATFLLPVMLQVVWGYSPLASGLAPLPLTVIMLALSARSGQLATRIGPRLQMSVGPVVVGRGLAMLTLATSGPNYAVYVLPAVIVLGSGWRSRSRHLPPPR